MMYLQSGFTNSKPIVKICQNNDLDVRVGPIHRDGWSNKNTNNLHLENEYACNNGILSKMI
jgi:hypothetical protein